MRKPIYNPLDVDLGFQEVIDSDFNPDIVQVFGIEMWDAGYRHGRLIGAAGTLMVLGSVCVIHRVYMDVKRKVPKKKKES